MGGSVEMTDSQTGGVPFAPQVMVPATVTTDRALQDEAAALERVDAMAGRAMVVHADAEVAGHEQPVVDRLRDQAKALKRVDDLHREPESLPPPAVSLTVEIPGALLRDAVAQADRTGHTIDELCVAGLELLLRGAHHDTGTGSGVTQPLEEETIGR